MIELATLILAILYLFGCKVGIALAICALISSICAWIGWFQRNF